MMIYHSQKEYDEMEQNVFYLKIKISAHIFIIICIKNNLKTV